MVEIKYHYTKAQALENADHYLGLIKQLDKMKRGRMMKVKSLSEVSKRWITISLACFLIAVISFIEFMSEKEMYLLVFAAFLAIYGCFCIVTSIRDKNELKQFTPVYQGVVTYDKKGFREERADGAVTEFTWKEFEYCIVTEKIITFFAKKKSPVFIAYDEDDLADFEAFLQEQKMDEDYVIKV